MALTSGMTEGFESPTMLLTQLFAAFMETRSLLLHCTKGTYASSGGSWQWGAQWSGTELESFDGPFFFSGFV